MIVCICNAVSERDIDDAVAEGVHNLETLQRVLPVANQCGSCRCCAEACVETSLDRRNRMAVPGMTGAVPLPA
ncbi:MAG: (2Fe-2S)-binding protein [Gammaproteobacteria bacterium]|nr:(2Fe-2S)-binding protein [Gammaproteobacteria bacterium]